MRAALLIFVTLAALAGSIAASRIYGAGGGDFAIFVFFILWLTALPGALFSARIGRFVAGGMALGSAAIGTAAISYALSGMCHGEGCIGLVLFAFAFAPVCLLNLIVCLARLIEHRRKLP